MPAGGGGQDGGSVAIVGSAPAVAEWIAPAKWTIPGRHPGWDPGKNVHRAVTHLNATRCV